MELQILSFLTMNTKRWVALLAFVTSAAVLPNAAGFITGVEFGTGGPPGVLGTYTMTGAFSVPGSEGDSVDSFSFSDGRTVLLSPALEHYDVPESWLTWSNGYTGKVLMLDVENDGETATLLLPAGTMAFYLYVEPDPYDWFTFEITATSLLGASTSHSDQLIYGDAGATGFGFYSSDAADPLKTITVTITDIPLSFAIGQFGIDGVPGVPDGGATAVLLGFAALALASLRRAWSR